MTDLTPVNKSDAEVKEALSKEERTRILDLEVRMAMSELEQAEATLKSVGLDKELAGRWQKRVDALKLMLEELHMARSRVFMTNEEMITRGTMNPAYMSESGLAAMKTLEEMGMEVAAQQHGTDLVLLYQEFGQNIEKFRDVVDRMKVTELERLNGVSVEALSEEMKIPFPDMPVYWRRQQSIMYMKYLSVLRSTGSHSMSQRASGILNRIQRYCEAASPLFMNLKDDALDECSNQLEDEARRRAVEGVDEPVFYQGDVVGYTKKYSDDLLKMLLRANRREKFIIEKKQDTLVNIQNNTFNLDGINIEGLKDKLVARIEGRLVDAEVSTVSQAKEPKTVEGEVVKRG